MLNFNSGWNGCNGCNDNSNAINMQCFVTTDQHVQTLQAQQPALSDETRDLQTHTLSQGNDHVHHNGPASHHCSNV